MKRVISVETNISDFEALEKSTCVVTKIFDDESTEVEEYSFVDSITIESGNNHVTKSLIKNIILPTEDFMTSVTLIEFKNCVFVNEVNLNFHQFDGKVIFSACIFANNFTLFGDFYNSVSFEQSSFINSKVDFQECFFKFFNFRITTFNCCDISFQETEFDDDSPLFSDIHLHRSNIRFIGTIFPTSAKLLNFLATEADSSSQIKFRLVDFNFREFRLFKAKISTLEFSECTFDCNRFEWDCECDTLIIQDCRNFRIMNLTNLKGLKHLNIHALLNTGKIILGDDVSYYLNSVKTQKDVYWLGSDEYRKPNISEIKDQLFTIVDCFATNQSKQIELVRHEIKIIEREEQILSEEGMGKRIFLSYSHDDASLADSIDTKFAQSGIQLIRDKRDIDYRESIKEFMKQIRFNDYVVLVISSSYLKSANCMYEIAELTKDENYRKRILPLIKTDTGIFDPIGRNSYVNYWQDEYKKLYSSSDMLDPLNRSGAISELLRYERIMRDLPLFLHDLADMDLILCDGVIDDIGFETILSVVNNTPYLNSFNS